MERQGVEKFEKRVLFNVVRWLSLAMGGIGLLMLFFGFVMLTKSWISISSEKSVSVTFEEVQKSVVKKEKAEMNPYENAEESQTPATEEVSGIEKRKSDITDEIVNLLTKDSPNVIPDKAKIFLLNATTEMKDKSAINFLNNLKTTIQKAPVGKKGQYAISFIELHTTKTQKEAATAAEKKFEALKNLGTYGYLTLTGLLTVVSFGIILILAAIERNTRRRDIFPAS